MRVVAAVESALEVECTNVCRPLNSYINRVYEVGLASGEMVVAKFYRPGRWSREALQDELDFLDELADAEVPVVPPCPGPDGELLHALTDHSWFAVFPKKGGRPLDEPSHAEWVQLGRLLGRMHCVGALEPPRDRIEIHPEASTSDHLDFILDAGVMPPDLEERYADLIDDLIDEIAPLFEDAGMLRLHGDCHGGNILHRPGEGFHLLDFDDMAVGPAVQDLWLLLPDRLPRCRHQLDLLLSGYETFRPFPHATLDLIEPLRAMRYIHYTAWCARQKADGGFTRLAPAWGTPDFWRQEIKDLQTQRREIHDALG